MNYSYESNSHKSKKQKPEKNIKKVVKGQVKIKNKSNFQKITEAFISDEIKNVKQHIVFDILIPELKKMTSDIIHNSINMIFGLNDSDKSSYSSMSYISYDKKYGSDNRNKTAEEVGHGFKPVFFQRRSDGEDVLTHMRDIIEHYGAASVADLYDLIGRTGNYTDNKYGWENLDGAALVYTRDGYQLRVPKIKPLD